MAQSTKTLTLRTQLTVVLIPKNQKPGQIAGN